MCAQGLSGRLAGANNSEVDWALTHAAYGGHDRAVLLLLDSGANVHAGNDAALQSATDNGHTAVVQLLLQHGADVHAGNGGALRSASYSGRANLVLLLIEQGAIVNADGGAFAVHWADKGGHPEIVQLLMRHGARRDLPWP